MTLGQEIEILRQQRGYSITHMCNILDVSPRQYHWIINTRTVCPLSIYQQICLIDGTQHYFKTIEFLLNKKH